MKKILNLFLLLNLIWGQSMAQSGNSYAELTVTQLEAQMKAIQTQDGKTALATKVVQSGREDLFDKCLEVNAFAHEINHIIRDLPPSPAKNQAILFILRASPSVWEDAKPGELENPMAGVNRVGIADLCAGTLQRYLPNEDFDLRHKGVLDQFSTRESRLKLAGRFESALASQSK